MGFQAGQLGGTRTLLPWANLDPQALGVVGRLNLLHNLGQS